MRLSDKALDEFIAIYKKDFAEEISRKEASEMAFRFVTLYELLLKLPERHTNASTPRDEKEYS